MSVVNNTLLLAAEEGGYQISRSVRFRSAASAYLNRTLTTPTDARKWTWSAWVKIGGVPTYNPLFAAGTTGSAYGALWFNNGSLVLFAYTGTTVYHLATTAVYRDSSAWYHVVVAFDSTDATSSNRVKIYVNGVQVTAFSTATYPSLNYGTYFNTAVAHNIGQYTPAGVGYYDGYLTEINFIDGQALTPSSFGETDAVTGVWKPKKYVGTYGTTGFYLNFKDNSAATATTIGKDSSGNGNNWTPNNISVTAGATYDSMIDVPTPYADGGNGRGNYCVLNPLAKAFTNGGTGTTSNGNLTITYSATNWYGHKGSIAVSSGKWYYEVINTSGTNFVMCGISLVTVAAETNAGVYRYRSTAEKINTSYTSYGATWATAGDICGIAFDLDAGTITFYKNGVSQGVAFTGIPTGVYAPEVVVENSTTANINFGQRPFAYTPPTGFKALNTQNLPESTIVDGSQHFDVVTRTGNNSSFSVTGLQFSPDFFWTKCRNTALAHYLADTVRGDDNILFSNLTNAEFSEPQYITAISSDGYTLGAGSNAGNYNGTGGTYVDWLWKASDSAAVTNTAGSITSTVSANTTSGFSIVTYTGNGSTSATVGHGLGVAPKMLIVKNRTTSGTNWPVWHTSLTNETFALYMDTTLAQGNANNPWGSGTISSTTFHITATGTGNSNQSSANFVAYCFSEVAGYSRFGSYTGNGSADGPFVYTGFRPAFVMIKRTDSTTYWQMYDTSRAPTNVMTATLAANGSDAEGSFAGGYDIDFVSNGFKPRTGPSNAINTSGGTYIYTAFAENPFKNALAR